MMREFFKKMFGRREDRFFGRCDWAAFWVATGVSFAVYFLTLGPSVGLEDSGELATAAAHLGVPHPPGYPFWTLCSWIFCKLFAGVTYMGHPTPAWAVSCCSAVFGAFAAGCMAMLICRSARDFIAPSIGSGAVAAGDRRLLSPAAAAWLCGAGGVGGALAFAFSPVEWSQATIVEIYSLNALFLALVFLLSYRWMRQPSDAVLWATAFVFGLGLTNYQVLLFAIVPLAIIIMLRNIPLFRDFVLYLIPVVLTWQVLDIGSLDRAQLGMERDAISKHAPAGVSDLEYAVWSNAELFQLRLSSPEEYRALRGRYVKGLADVKAELARAKTPDASLAKRKVMIEALIRQFDEVHRLAPQLGPRIREQVLAGRRPEIRAKSAACPSAAGLILALVLFVGSILAAIFFRWKGRPTAALRAVLGAGGAGLGTLLLSCSLFAQRGEVVWAAAEQAMAPLMTPFSYVLVAVLAGGSVLASVVAVLRERLRKRALIASAVCAAGAVATAWLVSSASFDLGWAFGYSGEPFLWGKSAFMFAAVLVALFALAAFVKNGLAYAIPVAGFHTALFILLREGAMNGPVHPSTWWFWWPVAWNFVVLALVWLMLPHGRSVAGAAFFAQLGVSFYAYMPLVSDWRNPPMNWGYPRTWEGFKHAITRGQYEQIKAEEFASAVAFWEFLKVQMGHYVRDVKLQFTDFLVLLAGVPFVCWQFCVGLRQRRLAVRALWLVLAVLVIFLLRELFGSETPSAGWVIFDRILLGVIGMIAVCGCAMIGVKQFLFRPAVALGRFVERCRARQTRLPLIALEVLAAELVLVPLILGVAFGGNGRLAIVTSLWIVALTALLLYLRPVLRGLRRLRRSFACGFEGRNISQQWLISSGACFLMMTVLLLILAKVVGDIQDGFIQKVKFISSHAMIALWIGYGLVLVAVALARFVPAAWRRFVIAPLVLVLVLVAAVPPFVQNYTNDRLVLELGGAEQNGHTFGWQFGAYQLEGARAIRRQLVADEEPLPDPEWPAPMEDHAIFFGGTDPGRFVPTYMIYSAVYRPDIYLITQNALADGTYMSVERDLYGDEIWIPANSDNSLAFETFVNRLSPEEERIYGVDKSNGRVQVTGAGSVMKINAILAEMMFEKNKGRHAFYVEESYPIDWMYDYLSPHGLILKLEPQETRAHLEPQVWRATMRKDSDFWDWYVRRLADDPMYRRDFAAQKSFAKLRSAIGGLYLDRGSPYAWNEERATGGVFRGACLQAFREACLLSPLSPESTFRYIRTLLVDRPGTPGAVCWLKDHPGDREGAELARYRLPPATLDVVEELLDYLDEQDPRNQRTAIQRPFVKAWRDYFQCEAACAAAGADRTSAAAFRLACALMRLAEAEQTAPARVDAARFFRRQAAELMATASVQLDQPADLVTAAETLTAAAMGDTERSRRYAERVLQLCQTHAQLTGAPSFVLDLCRLKAYCRLGAAEQALRLFDVLLRTRESELKERCATDYELQQLVLRLQEVAKDFKQVK